MPSLDMYLFQFENGVACYKMMRYLHFYIGGDTYILQLILRRCPRHRLAACSFRCGVRVLRGLVRLFFGVVICLIL